MDTKDPKDHEATPVNQPDLDAPADVLLPEVFDALTNAASGSKPDISGLAPATADGRVLFGAGDKIVVERYSTVLQGRPYLDTRTYKVLSVDEVGGDCRLHDEEMNQFATTNWKVGLLNGFVFKFAPGANKSRWSSSAVVVTSTRKRGRPRKNPTPTEVKPAADPTAPKKRGRKPGSKNRPAHVIAAEKAEKAALKRAKRAAKRSK